MTRTKRRTIHFYDVTAIQYDAQDRKIEHKANLDPLFVEIKKMLPIKGDPNTSFHGFWGLEMLVAVDYSTIDWVGGRFAKVRQDALPGLLSAGKFKRIVLGTDEYLHETSHFVYFRNSRILAIEYNHFAPNYKAFAKYLTDKAHQTVLPIDEIRLAIKMEQDTVARLLRAGAVTEVEIAIASDQATKIRQAGSLSKALRATADAQTQKFKAAVILSRERPAKDRPRGLADDLKKEVVELWQESGDILSALRVTVEPNAGGDTDVLDFKRDRFTTVIEAGLTPERSIDSGDVYAKIVKFYNDSEIGVVSNS